MFFLGWDGREQRLCWQCFPHQFGECHDTETLLPTRDWREERNSLISRHLHSLDCGGCNISLLHWTKRFIISSIPSIKYWDSQTDRVNLMLVHYWISRTPPSPASPLSVKTNLVLGILTVLFKNTIYISFGQMGPKIDICPGSGGSGQGGSLLDILFRADKLHWPCESLALGALRLP